MESAVSKESWLIEKFEETSQLYNQDSWSIIKFWMHAKNYKT